MAIRSGWGAGIPRSRREPIGRRAKEGVLGADEIEGLLREVAWWGSLVAEGLAVLVVMIGVLEAAVRIARIVLHLPGKPDAAKEGVRLRLGRWLAVALEFALAADILRTVVAPTWEEIGRLAAIATLRTLLNIFLEREIRQAEQHEERAHHAGTHHRGAEGR